MKYPLVSKVSFITESIIFLDEPNFFEVIKLVISLEYFPATLSVDSVVFQELTASVNFPD